MHCKGVKALTHRLTIALCAMVRIRMFKRPKARTNLRRPLTLYPESITDIARFQAKLGDQSNEGRMFCFATSNLICKISTYRIVL